MNDQAKCMLKLIGDNQLLRDEILEQYNKIDRLKNILDKNKIKY
jgi:hypothetical protein